MNKSRIIGFSLGPIGSAFIGFISLPVLAWLFSAEDIGRINMLQIFSSLSVIVFSLGLDQAFVREYHESNDKSRLLRSSFIPGFLFIICILAVIIISSPFLLSELFFSIKSAQYSMLIILCFVAVFFLRFFSLILRVQERGVAYSMSQIFPRFVFIFLVLFCFLFKKDPIFKDLLMAQTTSVCLAVLIFSWVIRRDLCAAVKVKLDRCILVKLLKFGLPLVIAGLASWGMTAMDKLFLRSIVNLSELGVYSIAVSVAAAVGVVTSIFNTVWAPIAFKWTAEGGGAKKIDAVSEHMAAVVCLLFVASGLLSWFIPFFLPDNYTRIKYIVTACMAAPLLYALSESTGIGLSINRKTYLSMLASCLAIAFSILTNYLLVPEYEAAGAAVATAITFWFFFFLRTELSCLAWRRFKKYKIYTGSMLSTTTAVVVAIWGEYLGALSLLIWLVVGLLGCIIYRNSLLLVPGLCKSFFMAKNI